MTPRDLMPVVSRIQHKIDSLDLVDLSLVHNTSSEAFIEEVRRCINEEISHTTNQEAILRRILAEYFEHGPLEKLLSDEAVTEIIINGPQKISFEVGGNLRAWEDCFLSPTTFNLFLKRLNIDCGIEATSVVPFANGKWRDFRVHMTSPPVSNDYLVQLRRLKQTPRSLKDLLALEMLHENQQQVLIDLLARKSNFLIVGGTGSGKTTLLNALLLEIPKVQRAVILEDTPELIAPNEMSAKIITRYDPQNLLTNIDQTNLVFQALRMRPDRIVVGEVRGGEAKDLLLALATGHSGSMGTLHADSAKQALIRLEMLVQLGAPQWSTASIRSMIHLSLQNIIVTKKSDGKRFVEGIYEISSLEEFGFLLEKIA